MSEILSELERQKRIAQARTWDANEKALAERLGVTLQTKLASRGKTPIAEASPLTDEERELWQDFVSWCAVEGVRNLPARGSSVASYMLDKKLTHEQMLDAIAVITKAHDRHGLSIPCGAAVRSVLELETDEKPPRSWRPEIKEVWARLPADIRHEIARIELSREVAFNRLYRRQADYTKQLERDVKANNVQDKTEAKPIARTGDESRASPG
jgi:hypothetical protein